LAVTGFLPLVVLALFNFLPVGKILPSYSEELIILLLGANILATVWTRWGLDRRIALLTLIGVGTGTRRQIVVWFGIATILSAFLPNTVVAAAMMPIVLAMLRFIGIYEVGKSAFVSATLLAFTRQFYSALLPGFNPAFAFLTFAVLCFVIQHNGEPLLRWDYAQKHMAWGLFYLFAGGTALGEILSQTGTAKYIADLLIPSVSIGIFGAVLTFSLITMVITQITSNTAAVAIMVPITISTFQGVSM